MESGRNISHFIDPWSSKDNIIGWGAIEHHKGDVEINSIHVDRKGDVPQCEFLLAAKPDEDYGATMDVRFICVHLLQSIEKDDIGGRAAVNVYSLDSVVNYEQWDDWCVMVRIDESGILIVDEGEH